MGQNRQQFKISNVCVKRPHLEGRFYYIYVATPRFPLSIDRRDEINQISQTLRAHELQKYDYGFLANARVATLQGIYNGKYVYNYRFADTPTIANGDADGFDQGISQWSVQVGFKYEF